MRVADQRHAPAALPLGKRRGTRCKGSRVVLKAGVDGCGKSRPPPGVGPGTEQYIARRYTDYALRIPAFWLLAYSVSFI
jgi:hypothetical protein